MSFLIGRSFIYKNVHPIASAVRAIMSSNATLLYGDFFQLPPESGPPESKVIKTIKNHIRSGAEDAFYVIDLDRVKQQYDEWVRELPRVEPFYAIKCNPDVEVLRRLTDLGSSFDCASIGEIDRVLSLGVSPDKIIYANPCKQVSHLVAAAEHGVHFMTFDCEEELHKIAAFHPGAQCMLRLKVDDSNSICQFSVKFGASLDNALGLLRTAQRLGVSIRGCSFHVGSNCQDAISYEHAVNNCRTVFDYAATLGMRFDMMDVGGGFPGVDRSTEPSVAAGAVNFGEIAATLRRSLDKHFPAGSGVRLIGEPGRYMVASSHTLAVAIIGCRARSANPLAAHKNKSFAAYKTLIDSVQSRGGAVEAAAPRTLSLLSSVKKTADTEYMYYVNDGLYGSFNNVLYEHASVHPRVLSLTDSQLVAVPDPGNHDKSVHHQSVLFESSLWGPTCDGMDCLTKNVKLPRLKLGDWLYFENMGAYTTAAGAEFFNGFERPRKFYI